MSCVRTGLAAFAIILFTLGASLFGHRPAQGDPPLAQVVLGEGPIIREHVSQDQIDLGYVPLGVLLQKGHEFFVVSFNSFDGVGRPEATGSDAPVARARRSVPDNFNRSSGPDSTSCVGCHNMPRPGGGGDNAVNAFVMAEFQEFTTDISAAAGNERNTVGMWGSGVIEMLGREMSAELQLIRQNAIQEAAKSHQPVTQPLITKGIRFGKITARPDGSTDDRAIEGVDPDLVIKPFHQKGVIASLRQFTVNAFNHHLGMQASERYGDGVDFDKDGVVDELTRGDITATVIFQAAMEVPGRVIPRNPVVEQAIQAGEGLFQRIGCADCHVPALTLNSPIFTSPSPYAIPAGGGSGGARMSPRGRRPFVFDLTQQGPRPRPELTADGKVIVRAFTDLKRHRMGPLCNNEKVVQNGVPTDQFLTKKLWGFYSEPPFMHNGRATTITEAILMHGDEGQAARDAFTALSKPEQDQLIEFLKSLQVLPEGSRSLVVDPAGQPR